MKNDKLIHVSTAFSLAALPLCAFADERPNIILINIDDMGWTDMSNNGSKYYETPCIDQLRADGVWFQEAYAGAANSAPSRACMLTGMNTPRHGMFTVGSAARGKSTRRQLIPIENRTSLEDGIQMLPEVLKAAGYQTAHIGKWHVTGNPEKNGMEYNIGGNHAGHPKSYFPPYRNADIKDGPQGEYLIDRLGNEAVKYLQQVDRNRPFFLYYATYAIHAPLQAPKVMEKKYKNKPSTQAHFNPTYAAMVEATDRTIGQILDQVKQMGIEENTLIVFTTDNGGVYKFSRQWPLRAGKGSFYEGGIRVPMIIYQKGKFEKKEFHHIPVQQMDLFPTFLELANISDDHLILDGNSLVPLMENKEKAFTERPLFWNFPGYLEGGHAESHDPYFRSTPVAVIRKGDWKLIKYYETDEVELFNIREDISEKNNVAQQQPKQVKKLLKELTAWQKDTKAPIATERNPEYKGK